VLDEGFDSPPCPLWRIKMTTQERKRITKLLFKTIKSFFGIQEKLDLTYFSLLEFDSVGVKYGWFRAMAKGGTVYKFRLDDYDKIDHLEIVE
jgi:hypothetical protein